MFPNLSDFRDYWAMLVLIFISETPKTSKSNSLLKELVICWACKALMPFLLDYFLEGQRVGIFSRVEDLEPGRKYLILAMLLAGL